jgi:hypothetical protein
MTGLIDFAPTVEDLLEIEPEDLGLILVSLARGAPGTSRRNFTVSEFEMPIWNANAPGYPTHPTSQQSVSRALAEAMQWLQTEGLVMVAPDQPNGYLGLSSRRSFAVHQSAFNALCDDALERR